MSSHEFRSNGQDLDVKVAKSDRSLRSPVRGPLLTSQPIFRTLLTGRSDAVLKRSDRLAQFPDLGRICRTLRPTRYPRTGREPAPHRVSIEFRNSRSHRCFSFGATAFFRTLTRRLWTASRCKEIGSSLVRADKSYPAVDFGRTFEYVQRIRRRMRRTGFGTVRTAGCAQFRCALCRRGVSG